MSNDNDNDDDNYTKYSEFISSKDVNKASYVINIGLVITFPQLYSLPTK